MIDPSDLLCLLDDFGTEVTLRSVTGGSYDPSTGSVTGGSNSDTTVKAYYYNYKLGENNGLTLGSRRVIFPPTDTSGNNISKPSVDDKIIGRGDTVSITNVLEVYSDVLLLYMVEVSE